MSPSKREHPEARVELRAAAFWYDDEQPGLGDDYLDAVDATVQSILDWPHAASVLPGWEGTPSIRSRKVGVFPYRVLYYHSGPGVVILAYAHQRRRPDYWRHRLE